MNNHDGLFQTAVSAIAKLTDDMIIRGETYMGNKIMIDPITRIEGHLRIEVEVEGGKVKDAWSSGQMFRGIELILQGRDPRDAHHFVQRSCGV